MISVHWALARLLVHSGHTYTASDQRSALGDSTDKRSVFVCEHRDLVSPPHIGGKLGLVEFKSHDLFPLMYPLTATAGKLRIVSQFFL